MYAFKVLVEICSRIERGRMTEEAANSVPKSVNNNSTNKKKPTKAAKAKVQRDSSVVKTPAAFEKYALSETEYSEGGHPVVFFFNIFIGISRRMTIGFYIYE